MSSEPQQKALTNPSQINPEAVFEDSFGTARGQHKDKPLRLGFIKLDGVRHFLRLRSRLQLRDHLFADVGADFSVTQKQFLPRSALEYRIHNKRDRHIATLRADRRALYVQKSFPINLFDKVTARLQSTAATTYDGIPEISIGLEQVKPPWLIAVGAAVMFATKGQVTGAKTFGGTTVGLPVVNHDSKLKGEAKASILRRGNGLALALNQLNGILWF